MSSEFYKGDDPVIESFENLMAGVTRFHVPVYQRRFTWGQNEIDQLWEDIKQLKDVDGDKENTFLGTIVFSPAPEQRGTAYQIIDGQQRITTLFLFCLSIIKNLKRLNYEKDSITELMATFQRDPRFRDHPHQIKLNPRIPDRDALDFLLSELAEDEKIYLNPNSRGRSRQDWDKIGQNTKENELRAVAKLIDGCLNEFQEGLSAEQETDSLLKLYESIVQRCLFCSIVLHETLDPNEVFQRLNDSGIKLTNFDLLKNHMMRKIMYDAEGELTSIADSEIIYTKHFEAIERNWYRTEKMWADAQIQKDRLKPYLFALARIRAAEYELETEEEIKIKGSDFHTLQKYYDSKYFNKEYEKGGDTTRKSLFESAINDLYEYKDIFSALTKDTKKLVIRQLHDNEYLSKLEPPEIEKLQTRIKRFSSFKIDDSTRPYLLMLFHSIIIKNVNFKKGIELLDVIESFLIRRQICGNVNKSVEIFRDLLSVPDKFDKETVLDQIEKDTQDDWIRNQELYDYIVGLDRDSAKGIANKASTYRFLVEEYDRLIHRGEPVDYSDFQVDHVIPQALNKEDKDLWEGWDRQEYEMWLHKWANLAPLTSKGNKWKLAKDFAKAKKLFNDGAGNNYSSATEVFSLDEWTPKQVKERAAKIANTVIKRWPLPESAATDKDKPENIERIDEDKFKGN